MTLTTQQARMSASGIARPYLRGVFPIATPSSAWRRNAGLSYSGNCHTSIAGVFTNLAFTNQTATMTATWDATPGSAANNTLVTISSVPVTTFADAAMLVRFSSSNFIQAWDEGVSGYASDTAIAYSAGVSQAFRLVANIPAETYDVFVDEVQLAANFAYRTVGETNMDTWTHWASTGHFHEVCNFRVVTTVLAGRIMGSLAGKGGLAGRGGIAGDGGGLAA